MADDKSASQESASARPTNSSANDNKKSSSGRLLLLVLLLGGALLLSYLDRSARAKCQAHYDRIDQALLDNQSIENTTVHEWLGKAPDRVTDNETGIYSEEFDFRGVLRKQTIFVGYSRGATKLVNKIAME